MCNVTYTGATRRHGVRNAVKQCRQANWWCAWSSSCFTWNVSHVSSAMRGSFVDRSWPSSTTPSTAADTTTSCSHQQLDHQLMTSRRHVIRTTALPTHRQGALGNEPPSRNQPMLKHLVIILVIIIIIPARPWAWVDRGHVSPTFWSKVDALCFVPPTFRGRHFLY